MSEAKIDEFPCIFPASREFRVFRGPLFIDFKNSETSSHRLSPPAASQERTIAGGRRVPSSRSWAARNPGDDLEPDGLPRPRRRKRVVTVERGTWPGRSAAARFGCIACPEARLTVLQRELRRGEYHILHFIGHAGFDREAQGGRARPVRRRGERAARRGREPRLHPA